MCSIIWRTVRYEKPHVERVAGVLPPGDTELLRAALRTVSYGVPRAQVHEDAAWLERHGLVSREDVGGALIMKITRRGLDVVTGDEVVEGVERSCLEA